MIDNQKLSGLLEHLMENEMVLDGVLAQDQTQFASLWSLRELLPEACGKAGSVYKYDLSVPVGRMYTLVEKMRERLRKEGLMVGDGQKEGPIRACVGYGHMGDGEFCPLDFCANEIADNIGNLHINIVANKYTEEIEKVIEPFVYEITG
jgi:FAD/FMN-containing dehydrogenase